ASKRCDAIAVEVAERSRQPLVDAGRDFGRLRPDRRLDRSRLDDRDADTEGLKLDPERVRDRLERMLRRGVGAEEGQRALPGNRADEDDSSSRAPQLRKQGLGDRDLSEDVYLELAA